MNVVECILVIIICVFAAIGFTTVLLGVVDLIDNSKNMCSHEYVATSVYDNEVDSYRVYSRCLKCGNEI